MLESIFSLQAKMFQTMTEVAVTNMNNSIKLANDLMNAGTQGVSKPAEKKTKAKAKTSTTAKKKELNLPVPFNYFPNLYHSDSDVAAFPFTPEKIAEAWQGKMPAIAAMPFANGMSAFPASTLNPFSALNPLQAGFANLMPSDTGNSLKGFMVFFDIPLENMNSDMLPWNQFSRYMK